MNKKIGVLVGGIIILALALFALNMFLAEEEGLDQIPDGPADQGEVEVISVDSLIVPDQASGVEVFVERVLLKTGGTGGYVVIDRPDMEMDVATTSEEEMMDEEEMAEDAEKSATSTEEMVEIAYIGVSEYMLPGVTANMIVALMEGEEARVGDTLRATLYSDDGDHFFETDEDVAIVGDDGEVVQVTFQILAEEDIPGFETKL